MKFLIDVCIGAFVEQQIIENLIEDDFLQVRSINSKMLDTEIVEIANQQDRIIITSDKDFGDLVFQSQLAHKGILLLRIDEMPFDERTKTIIAVLKDFKHLIKDKFAVYQNGKIRIR